MLIAIKDGKIRRIQNEDCLEELCDVFRLFNKKAEYLYNKGNLNDDDYKKMLKSNGFEVIKVEGEKII